MKTLDEVIKAYEYCINNNYRDCRGCPYGCEDGESGCTNADEKTDVLHYLKEYQGLSKMWNDKLDKEQENPALTWDELRTMEGKPVWVEINGYNGYWTIVHWNSNIVFMEYYDWLASPKDYRKAPVASLDDTNFGTTWQAYRKERNDHRRSR